MRLKQGLPAHLNDLLRRRRIAVFPLGLSAYGRPAFEGIPLVDRSPDVQRVSRPEPFYELPTFARCRIFSPSDRMVLGIDLRGEVLQRQGAASIGRHLGKRALGIPSLYQHGILTGLHALRHIQTRACRLERLVLRSRSVLQHDIARIGKRNPDAIVGDDEAERSILHQDGTKRIARNGTILMHGTEVHHRGTARIQGTKGKPFPAYKRLTVRGVNRIRQFERHVEHGFELSQNALDIQGNAVASRFPLGIQLDNA